MNKKYLIIGIISTLIILVGVSIAYFSAQVSGDTKKVTIKSGSIYVIFTDGEIINAENIGLNWTYKKEFSVENQSSKEFYYDINLEELLNTFETHGFLQYKITSKDTGESMEGYEAIDQCKEGGCTQTLLKSITIAGKTTQNYEIEFRYIESASVNQSGDMGKKFSGKLRIVEGKKKTLADFFKDKYPEAEERTYFISVEETGGVHKESGAYTEDIDGDGEGEEVYYWTGNVNDTPYDMLMSI